MAAIAKVTREIYLPAPRPGVCVHVHSPNYTGKGLRREESMSYETSDDWCDTHQVRTTEDGGRTWSEWKVVRKEWPMLGGFSKEEAPMAQVQDPTGGGMLRLTFQRILIGEGPDAIARSWKQEEPTYFDHNLWQVSEDGGRTWGPPRVLRYEDGPEFDPEDWGNKEYLRTNLMYGGNNAVATRQGRIVYPACGVPLKITDRGKEETVCSVRCFIGRWDEAESTFEWESSDSIWVPHRISGRGLLEPEIAELEDGRLLLVMRGSNEAPVAERWHGKVESPGRRWMSLSEDGGRTWAPVTDLRYDTGEAFYSPSSISKMLRHRRTGKLYWFGNISPTPPVGNGPRHPLYLAEVEESIPALRKDALTVIDYWDPESDPGEASLSNFTVFEHPEDGHLELYMNRPYQKPAGVWTADAYKYTIRLL